MSYIALLKLYSEYCVSQENYHDNILLAYNTSNSYMLDIVFNWTDRLSTIIVAFSQTITERLRT